MPRDGGMIRQLWLSPWTGWVALRYLKSKKNSRFLSFITLLSVLGVGLGVTAMIVVLSVMDGFEAELKKRLMSSDLHVLIQPTSNVPGFDSGFVPKEAFSQDMIDRLMKENPDILQFWPMISTEVILKSARKVSGVVIKGITPARMERLKAQVTETAEPQMLIQHEGSQSIRLPGIFVGQELAYEMNLIPGDQVTLISPTEREGPMNAVPRLKRYVIEGIYRSGFLEQELHTVFASEQAARSFLRRADAVSQWEVSVKDFEDAPQIASKIRRVAPLFKVQDWVQLNSQLFASLKLERVSMFIVLAFIIVVASFNIVTTLTLMVLEKTREISILKAMGARNSSVAAIFLAEGIYIGAIGVAGGLLFGFLICAVLRRYDFISLPDIYYDRTLPVTFAPLYYALVAACAVVIVLLACLYPSKRALKLSPLEGIRYG